MTLYTTVHLGLCFSQMGVDRRLIFAGKLCSAFQQTAGTCVLRMKSDKITEQRMILVKFLIILFCFFQCFPEILLPAHTAHLYTPHSHVHTGPGCHLRGQIHIKNSRDTAGQVFQNRQLRQMIDHLPVHSCLNGKYLFRKPVMQRQVICIGTEQRHTGMSVCIFKAGHKKISLTVYFSVPQDAFLSGLPAGRGRVTPVTCINDTVILHPELTLQDLRAFHC